MSRGSHPRHFSMHKETGDEMSQSHIVDKAKQREKAAHFSSLHGSQHILVLPNAWDAASAKMFERAGFGAVATTSAGIANAYGYPDGERMSRDEMLDVVRRIANVVGIPMRATMSLVGRIAEEIKQNGTYNFARDIPSYSEVNGYFEK